MDITSFVLGLMKGRKSGKGFYSTEENEAGGMTYSFSATEAGGGEEGDIGAEKYIEARHAEVVLPNAKSIKPYAFYSDNVLKHIEMPKVKSIGTCAFSSCSNLALTSLPSGLTSIGDQAFTNCSQLALTSLPSGLTSIGNSSFYFCTFLALTSLPSGLTSIGASAFYRCTALTTITFEGKPTSIESDAFNRCTNIKTINVPWAEGAVANAPWGATSAQINYNYVEGE